MGLQGDFLNALKQQNFSEEEALQALQNVTTKKPKSSALSRSAPAGSASRQVPTAPLYASQGQPERTQLAPQQALRTMVKWVSNTNNVTQLDATSAAHLRQLCKSQGEAAQQTETGLFSSLFSSTKKEQAKIMQTVDKADKELFVLLSEKIQGTGGALFPYERKELIKLLAEGTLEKFPKEKRNALAKPFMNPSFIRDLIDSSDETKLQAFKNLVKHAYSTGQLYQLLQKLDLEVEVLRGGKPTPPPLVIQENFVKAKEIQDAQEQFVTKMQKDVEMAKAKIQEAVEEGMQDSIAQPTKKGLLTRLFGSSSPTLLIPLDPSRDSQQYTAKTLDNILGAACAKTVIGKQMGYSDPSALKFAPFFTYMITATGNGECKIPILESCFEKPKRAQQIAGQNNSLMQQLERLTAKEIPTNSAKSALEKLRESTPQVPGEAASACKIEEQAIIYDVLGIMNAVVDPKRREEAIVSTGWNAEDKFCVTTALQENLSPDARKQLREAQGILKKPPSLARYETLKQVTDELRKSLEKTTFQELYAPLYQSAPPSLQERSAQAPPPRVDLSRSAPSATVRTDAVPASEVINSTKKFLIYADFYRTVSKNKVQSQIPDTLQSDKWNILGGKIKISELEAKLGPEHQEFLTAYKEYQLINNSIEKAKNILRNPSNITSENRDFFINLPANLHQIDSKYDQSKKIDAMMLEMIKKSFKENFQIKKEAEIQKNRFYTQVSSHTAQNKEVLEFFLNPKKTPKEKLDKINALIAREIQILGKEGADYGRECVLAFVLSIPENQREKFLESFFSLPEPGKDEAEVTTAWGHIREAISYFCFA